MFSTIRRLLSRDKEKYRVPRKVQDIIPVKAIWPDGIFLTGKNDRDHVFSILHYKPDGYLLKTLSKEALIDSIDRFFSESLFQMSLHHIIEDTD